MIQPITQLKITVFQPKKALRPFREPLLSFSEMAEFLNIPIGKLRLAIAASAPEIRPQPALCFHARTSLSPSLKSNKVYYTRAAAREWKAFYDKSKLNDVKV
jgi:hypothetical protein